MQLFNKPLFHCAVLVFIVFLVYVHTFDAGFIFDDYAHQEMLKLISAGKREMNLFNFITTPEEATYYTQMTAVPWWTNPHWRLRYFRPVATLSHLFDYTLWGSNPLPYHVHNVTLYALLVALLYLFYRALSRHNLTAFCGSLVFALQPCHYMTVRWPASRNDIICAVMLVASFICYLRFCEKKKPIPGMLFTGFYLLALLTKEIAFVFPVLFFAYDWTQFRKLKGTLLSRWKVYLALAVLNGSYLLFYRAGGYGSYWYGERLLVDYPLDFAKAASLYLCSLFYGGVFASGGPDFLARYWPVVALLLLCVAYITYLFLTQRNRFPEISLFTLWIALPLPFIVVPPLNDRLLIIPSIGLAYLAGLAMTRLEKKGLTIFFLVTGLMLPPITNGILAREHDKVLQTSYEHFYAALDRIIPHKTSRDALFILNFPEVGTPELGLSGENYMYLALYFDLYYKYPEWQVPHYPLDFFKGGLDEAVDFVSREGMKIYPLSAFDGAVSLEVLDDHRLRISHPNRFYFETNTEKLFSLNRTFSAGETFRLPDLTITLDSLEGGRVKSIVAQSALPLDHPRYFFLYYDKGGWKQWHPLTDPPPFTVSRQPAS